MIDIKAGGHKLPQSLETQALLIMDVQAAVLDRLESSQKAYLEKVTAASDAAHHRNIPVIHVVVGFRSGFPEVSAHNRTFSQLKDAPGTALVDPGPALTLADNDLVVIKHRVSAFSGSDLEMILRSTGITHLVLCGIATSGVVLSTLREAADKDYELTVLSDLCLDFDPEVHDVLTKKVFTRQATVTTSSDWQASLKASPNV